MKKIIVVEDDPDIVELVIDILSDSYQITYETDVEKLFKRTDMETFDLIITDFLLEKYSAKDIIEKFKNKKFLIISALSDNSSQISSLVDNKKIFYLQKPFVVDDLMDKVDNILK
uniref:Response regulator n=1 Tax=candidate division WOR-3 bacterium TaxID=2052148 RepID=A0A7C3J5N4_UNCW3